MMGLLDLPPCIDGPPNCWAVIILTSSLTEHSISARLAAISSFVAQSTYFPWLRSFWTSRRRRPMNSSPLETQEDISNNNLLPWQKQIEEKTHEITKYVAGTIWPNI